MIIDCGCVAYDTAWRLQRELVRKRAAGEIGDSIIITEHDPVFTIGRSGSRNHVLVDDAACAAKGLRIINVDRGGDVTFHGPGQLIIYPIIDLHHRPDLHRYMRDLEEVGIAFLKDFSVVGQRVAGRTGVWVGNKKIASIGIGARNWITYHGMSVNIATDLRYFSLIDPCGMRGLRMTSLERVLARTLDRDTIKDRLLYYARTILLQTPISYACRPDNAAVA